MNKLLRKYGSQPIFYQFFRKMKLTILIVTVSILSCFSAETYSQNTKLTITENNSTLLNVLKAIEAQSEFKFFYNEKVDVNKQVSVEVNQKSVTDILDKVLLNSSIKYKVLGRQIALYDKEEMEPFISEQQGKKVTGKVTDQSGVPIPGATIIVKETTIGITSDNDGNFSLSLPVDANVLVFSFVGMKTQEVKVGKQKSFNIVLEQETIGLEEVVAVGYGTTKKVNLTGSIASVTNKDLKSSTTMSLKDNMAGKLPGLRVMQRSSEPGEYNSNFDIRGWGSPLIIVDGIQRDNFDKMDPNEIESVTVLKDASAAVYGVKAANGVILINTKKGKEGKSEITYNATYGMQNVTSFPKPMNAAEFAESYNWAQVNSGQVPTYSQQQIDDFKSGKSPSTNWWDVAMDKSAPQQTHNLTFSGGTDKVKYFTSLGYYDQQGLFKSGDLNYKRYNLRANITAQITNNLEAELIVGGISDEKKSPATWTGGVFKGIWMQIPVQPLYANNNPNYLQNLPDGNNPYAVTHSSIIGYNNTWNKTFQGSLALNYKIPFIEGLKARFLYGYDLNHYFNKTFNKQYALYDYDTATKTYNPSYNNSPSNLSEGYSESNRSTLQASLNYEKTIKGKHNIKGLLLYENLKIANDNFNGNRQFTVDAVDQLYAGNSKQQITSDPNNVYELDNQGIVGRLNYDYSSKYLFEFSFREDGSSKFPGGKRWGFFPALSLGWRLSEESFIKNNFSFISNLKLRGSWGQMGDDAASSFQFMQGYTYPTSQTLNGNPLGYMFGGNQVTGIGFIGMVNPNITWYKATTSNVGIDGTFWNGMLNFQFDAFKRERTGLLDTRLLSLPQTVGASLPQENLNGDLSHGFEIMVGTTQHFNDISFGISGQLSYTHTQWLHKEEATAGNSYLNWRNSNTDRSNNIIWGNKLDGQFQTQEQINNAPVEDGQGNRFVKPGDLKYTDINGDGVIDDWDVVPIAKGSTGNQSIPEINYGLTLTFAWKHFDMSALFQGATNFSVQLNEQLTAPFPWGRNGLSQFYDIWHQADFKDPNSQWIPGTYAPARLSGVNPNGNQSPYYIKNASYLRFKSLEIGYTVSDRLTKKLGISKLRVFGNGFNLITWSKIPYMDPEHPQDQYGYMYPITRNFNLGVTVTF